MRRERLGRALFFVVGASLFVLACTTTREVHVPVYATEETPDASTKPVTKPSGDDDDDDDDTVEKKDAGSDAAKGLTPTGKTNATVTLNDVKRTLERGQFGFNKDGALHIEVYEGGDPACPEEGSPSPKRTLIIDNVKVAGNGTKQTKADGLTTALLDLTNDQLPQDHPASTAKTVTIEIVAAKTKEEIELELTATFAEGSASGRVFAQHCASMDEK